MGPIALSVLGVFGWMAIGHNSGSGWVQALGCLLAGFVLVGLGGPAVATARVAIEVTANPLDARVGQPSTLQVETSAPVRVEPLDPPGLPVLISPGRATIVVTAPRRGPLEELHVKVSSGAPFGLLWWSKRLRVPLGRTTWVAPLPAPGDSIGTFSEPAEFQGRHRPERDPSGAIRSVRPYVIGDPRRTVHWTATAHAGQLMVREAERPVETVQHVEVVLPDDGPAGDAVAARALGTVVSLLARGPVTLSTTERGGRRTEMVMTASEAGRRMARAVASP